MGRAIAVRTNHTAGEVRGFARRAKDVAQARRLLAIAAVLGYFDPDAREYRRIPIDEQVEVLSLTGDVALECARYDHKLVLKNCTFRGRFDATDSYYTAQAFTIGSSSTDGACSIDAGTVSFTGPGTCSGAMIPTPGCRCCGCEETPTGS